MLTTEQSLKSERFIHDGLVRKTKLGISGLYDSWKQSKKVAPFFLAWPATAVQAQNGDYLTGVCRLELEDFPREEWRQRFLEAIQLTNAYAILLCEQHEKDIKLTLESPHGTHSWTIPVRLSGDVYTLGQAKEATDQDSLGLLWHRISGIA